MSTDIILIYAFGTLATDLVGSFVFRYPLVDRDTKCAYLIVPN